MSDAIREALGALDYLADLVADHPGMPDGIEFEYNKVKYALQSSQTAPAVPEGWMLVPIEPTEHMVNVASCSASIDIREADACAVYRAMLDAAPQPDHSPDAGKVVPFGFVNSDSVRDFMSGKELFIAVYRPEACESWVSKAPLYTHPAESREEIQVQALDGVWDKLYDMADERSASDPEEASGIMTAVNFIKGEAARLRASQQEGEDNDK